VTPDELLGRVLLDMALVLVIARLFSLLLRKLHEPPVMAEMLAGIALGPTILGALPGDLSSELFPKEVRGVLSAIGGVGLVLFMFLIGLELDLKAIRKHRRVVPSISLGALILPLATGLLLAFILFRSHNVVDGHPVHFAPFALFIATALSITAFPVLARILIDRGLDRTPLGGIATAVAAAQDTAGWILLAVALAVHTGGGAGQVTRVAVEALAFVVVSLAVIRPLIKRFIVDKHPDGPIELDRAALVVAGLIAFAGTTQLIGLHSVLGAFFFGAMFPRRERPEVAAKIGEGLRPVTMAVLPIYFLVPGLNVDVRAIGSSGVGEMLLIIVLACTAKLVGAYIGARAAGVDRRGASLLGILMNTRGLVELIVLNVALTAGIIGKALFSELVLMALFTTLMAPPLLDLVRSSRRRFALGGETPLLAGSEAERSA
jgi:Kef-type K+ transport system membrane component KefB